MKLYSQNLVRNADKYPQFSNESKLTELTPAFNWKKSNSVVYLISFDQTNIHFCRELLLIIGSNKKTPVGLLNIFPEQQLIRKDEIKEFQKGNFRGHGFKKAKINEIKQNKSRKLIESISIIRKSSCWEIEFPAINFLFSLEIISEINNILSPVQKLVYLEKLFQENGGIKQSPLKPINLKLKTNLVRVIWTAWDLTQLSNGCSSLCESTNLRGEEKFGLIFEIEKLWADLKEGQMVIDFYHSDLFLFELLQRKVSLNRIFSLDYNLVNDEEKEGFLPEIIINSNRISKQQEFIGEKKNDKKSNNLRKNNYENKFNGEFNKNYSSYLLDCSSQSLQFKKAGQFILNIPLFIVELSQRTFKGIDLFLKMINYQFDEIDLINKRIQKECALIEKEQQEINIIVAWINEFKNNFSIFANIQEFQGIYVYRYSDQQSLQQSKQLDILYQSIYKDQKFKFLSFHFFNTEVRIKMNLLSIIHENKFSKKEEMKVKMSLKSDRILAIDPFQSEIIRDSIIQQLSFPDKAKQLSQLGLITDLNSSMLPSYYEYSVLIHSNSLSQCLSLQLDYNKILHINLNTQMKNIKKVIDIQSITLNSIHFRLINSNILNSFKEDFGFIESISDRMEQILQDQKQFIKQQNVQLFFHSLLLQNFSFSLPTYYQQQNVADNSNFLSYLIQNTINANPKFANLPNKLCSDCLFQSDLFIFITLDQFLLKCFKLENKETKMNIFFKFNSINCQMLIDKEIFCSEQSLELKNRKFPYLFDSNIEELGFKKVILFTFQLNSLEALCQVENKSTFFDFELKEILIDFCMQELPTLNCGFYLIKNNFEFNSKPEQPEQKKQVSASFDTSLIKLFQQLSKIQEFIDDDDCVILNSEKEKWEWKNLKSEMQNLLNLDDILFDSISSKIGIFKILVRKKSDFIFQINEKILSEQYLDDETIIQNEYSSDTFRRKIQNSFKNNEIQINFENIKLMLNKIKRSNNENDLKSLMNFQIEIKNFWISIEIQNKINEILKINSEKQSFLQIFGDIGEFFHKFQIPYLSIILNEQISVNISTSIIEAFQDILRQNYQDELKQWTEQNKDQIFCFEQFFCTQQIKDKIFEKLSDEEKQIIVNQFQLKQFCIQLSTIAEKFRFTQFSAQQFLNIQNFEDIKINFLEIILEDQLLNLQTLTKIQEIYQNDIYNNQSIVITEIIYFNQIFEISKKVPVLSHFLCSFEALYKVLRSSINTIQIISSPLFFNIQNGALINELSQGIQGFSTQVLQVGQQVYNGVFKIIQQE